MPRFKMPAFLLALVLLAFGSVASAQLSVGIRIGPPPAPRVLRVRPRQPGPGYVWVAGYWYPVRNRYVWHAGYWTRPPYEGAHWVEPHHDGREFFAGYWEGDHGRVEHDHSSDRRGDRDYRRDDNRRGR